MLGTVLRLDFRLASVSCPSATFCVTVDIGGAALIYRRATAPKNTGLPIIKGKDKGQSKLTASNGAWTGAALIAYKYQWDIRNAKAKKCQAVSEIQTSYTTSKRHAKKSAHTDRR
jgi:hypothetical protein